VERTLLALLESTTAEIVATAGDRETALQEITRLARLWTET